MLGNFQFYNPTRIYFGENALQYLSPELANYGRNVLLVYGGGSIKKNGIYDEIVALLQDAGKRIVELPGVMPNPTLSKLIEGAELARRSDIDLILAVGGGSVCDYAKGVALSAYCREDPWEKFYLRNEEPEDKVLPVACVLTMVGTGSEMNSGSVITNEAQKRKVGRVLSEKALPKFSILNPRYTMSLPKYQMVSGIFDILCHIHEQYFSGHDDNTSDYIAEGLMRSLIHSAAIALEDPQNYEARSNIMWTSTMALNKIIGLGKPQDWQVHMIGQSIGAYTDAAHGMTLSAVTLPYFEKILLGAVQKFARYAVYVWGVDPKDKTEESVAREGLSALETWMRRMGVVCNAAELGVTPDMVEDIADGTFLMRSGYRQLTRQDVIEILQASLRAQ